MGPLLDSGYGDVHLVDECRKLRPLGLRVKVRLAGEGGVSLVVLFFLWPEPRAVRPRNQAGVVVSHIER